MSRCTGGIGLGCGRAPVDDVVTHVLRDANRHQDGLVDTLQRLIQTVVLDDLVGIGQLDREVVHDLADLLEDRQHRLLPLVAVLAVQDARSPVPQGCQHLRMRAHRPRHLDHRCFCS